MDMGGGSPIAAIKLLLPKTPVLVKAATAHALGLSEVSKKWDLKQNLAITTLRAFCDPKSASQTVTATQKGTLKDAGVKGKLWVSKYEIPGKAQEGLRQAVFKAVDELSEGLTLEDEDKLYASPETVDVGVEWTGYRADAKAETPEPAKLSEAEKYEKLMSEVTGDSVILYFHGGAHYLMDPATHRGVTSKLAQLTGGRAYSVRYRLSPQNPFPAALVDALVAYLSLISPSDGAPHQPVLAKNIVFAGDSAGGNLALALLQLLLHFQRTSVTSISFHGKDVPVELPGGIALNSPWCDIFNGLPNKGRFAKYDYLSPSHDFSTAPACDIWPPKPARIGPYSTNGLLYHPLVSPVAATNWTGAPPAFFAVGEEILRDEGAAVAERIAKSGTPVVWEQYEAMPHCSALVFVGMPFSERTFESWASFVKDVTSGKTVTTKGTYIHAKTLKTDEMDPTKLLDADAGFTLEGLPALLETSRKEWVAKWNESEAKRVKKQGGKSQKL